jgi:hypothetical protein
MGEAGIVTGLRGSIGGALPAENVECRCCERRTATTKAQVEDLGQRVCDGGGGRI